jgi:hypothetical protein
VSAELRPAPVADVAPLPALPDRIALCTGHGWWFPAEPGELCPQAGCEADVAHYTHTANVKGRCS